MDSDYRVQKPDQSSPREPVLQDKKGEHAKFQKVFGPMSKKNLLKHRDNLRHVAQSQCGGQYPDQVLVLYL